ncbi:2-amino-4-hydroxy-6-hydroxymethyldihydropteridine diphosphokinase [Mucilaginibacter sp.]|uniref:2-amino-4-hydroxy-6- hydroxymethyldihydropteridine diphosphokinase n=1 Tax=Mucilaginibacter sp. TaxID=1882438 RepID=UPI003AFFDC63
MQTVYFLLGSNLGDKKTYLKEALLQLEKNVGRTIRTSSIYETQSWGVTGQPDYLNQVVEMETLFLPDKILEKTQKIENFLHRERTKKWGSRTIDIDVLFFGKEIIDLPQLKIPHPQIQHRLFTLVPLNELIPDFVHPILNKTIQELRQEVGDGLLVKKIAFTN